jgi:hypothetical protein
MDVPEFAFIIPIAPKHFGHLAQFLRSNPWKNTFVVFSSKEDYDNFDCKDNCIPLFASCDGRQIINYKKFEGLKQAIKQGGEFKYFIVCDAEIEIVANNFNGSTITRSLERFFSSKCIFAGDIELSRIGKGTLVFPTAAAGLFKSEDDRVKISGLTNNFRLYTWWSDIPVYAAEHLDEFFNLIDESKLSYESFDHLAYQYYLLLYRDFKIIQIPGLKWSLELFNGEFADLEKYGVNYNWVAKYSYQQNQEYFNSNGTYLLYHLDRIFDLNMYH